MHSKLAPASAEENVNAARVELLVPEGPESIVVPGGVRSMVQLCDAGGPVFVEISTARTENVCRPSLRPV